MLSINILALQIMEKKIVYWWNLKTNKLTWYDKWSCESYRKPYDDADQKCRYDKQETLQSSTSSATVAL